MVRRTVYLAFVVASHCILPSPVSVCTPAGKVIPGHDPEIGRLLPPAALTAARPSPETPRCIMVVSSAVKSAAFL